MSYMLIEFEENDGGGLAVVASNWITPRKKEVFWPSTKNQKVYKQALQSLQEPDTTKWNLYKISRQFYETDNLGKAEEKLKLAEVTSDLATDSECSNKRKRKLKKPSRFVSPSGSEEEDEDNLSLKRPPLIKWNENASNNLSSEPYSAVQDRPICNRTQVAVSSQFSELSQEVCDTRQLSLQLTPVGGSQSGYTKRSVVLENTPSNETTINSLQASTSDLRRPVNNETSHGIPRARGDELEFRTQILTLLNIIKEQNIQILNYIKNKDVSKTVAIPADFPVQLPLTHLDDIKHVEEYLKCNEKLSSVVVYLNSVGGKDCTSKTNRILKIIFTDDLATQYSFYGKRLGKIPFGNLLLKEAVITQVAVTRHIHVA